MNHPERSHGYFFIAFAAWFLIGLFAWVTLITKPESMTQLGQFGDFFGFFNSLLTLGTAFAAYRALHGQLAASNDQKQQFLEQQRYQQKFLLGEKMEKLLMELKRYQMVVKELIRKGIFETVVDDIFDITTRCHGCRSNVRIVISLYFPSLLEEFRKLEDITISIFEAYHAAIIEEDANKKVDKASSAGDLLRKFNDMYVQLNAHLASDTERVIEVNMPPLHPKT